MQQHCLPPPQPAGRSTRCTWSRAGRPSWPAPAQTPRSRWVARPTACFVCSFPLFFAWARGGGWAGDADGWALQPWAALGRANSPWALLRGRPCCASPHHRHVVCWVGGRLGAGARRKARHTQPPTSTYTLTNQHIPTSANPPVHPPARTHPPAPTHQSTHQHIPTHRRQPTCPPTSTYPPTSANPPAHQPAPLHGHAYRCGTCASWAPAPPPGPSPSPRWYTTTAATPRTSRPRGHRCGVWVWVLGPSGWGTRWMAEAGLRCCSSHSTYASPTRSRVRGFGSR